MATDPATLYTEDDLQTLTSLAHIRHRPGMYIGSADQQGLHHLLWELVANSIDEQLAGYGDRVEIALFDDGSCRVTDFGRGISVHPNQHTGRPLLVDVMTVPGASTKAEGSGYRCGPSLYGIGLKAVNALSEWCEVETHHAGGYHRIEFARGEVTRPLEHVGLSGDRTGTVIHFKPDPALFGTHTFDLGTILRRLCELAFLNGRLKLAFTDARTGKTDKFHFPDGLTAYVKYLNTGQSTLHDPLHFHGSEGEVKVEVALQFRTDSDCVELGYVNNEFTRFGGTHLTGLRRGLTLAFKQFAKEDRLLPARLNLKGEDCREGLTAVVSVRHPYPRWEGATRSSIGNSELDGLVSRVVRTGLADYFDRHPSVRKKLGEHVARAARFRAEFEAAKHCVRLP
jgi:DNA gyrase subunit B